MWPNITNGTVVDRDRISRGVLARRQGNKLGNIDSPLVLNKSKRWSGMIDT